MSLRTPDEEPILPPDVEATGRRVSTRRQQSLRSYVTIALSGMVLLTAGVITLVSWLNARQNAETTIALVTEHAIAQTETSVRSYLKPATDVVSLAATHASAGILHLDSIESIERYFFQALQVHPTVETMCWADADGNFIMVQRGDDGSLDTKIIQIDKTAPGGRRVLLTDRVGPQDRLEDSPTRRGPSKPDTYQPRQRPWYRLAQTADSLVWTDAYLFHTKRIPGLTAAYGVRQNGTLRGVLCADVTLRGVSEFLKDLTVGHEGQAILVDKEARLLASPQPNDVVGRSDDDKLHLKQAASSGMAHFAAFAQTDEWQSAVQLSDAEGTGQVPFTHDGHRYIGTLRRLNINQSAHWFVCAVVPEEDFLGPIRDSNTSNAVFSLILLLLAFITSLFIARQVSNALSTLVNEAREITRLSFVDHPEITSSFREVNDVLDAFENMKVGLRSFQKYLPLKLVRRLLANQEEPELGGEFMELTIFFSDIADFTPINESMHPMEMARRLGSYLAALTDEIESRQGTVVQYVGDEIMALWGAPQSVQDHATLACHAALACASRVDSLWEESDVVPSFRTRFGIHTADVAVGHFGSTERLYYGAIGDGINATSRLEGLNKFYGTSILISESTRQLVDDGFHARRVDKVAVKGKSLPITVYELLGTADDPTIDMTWVNRWETAYSCYLKREFSDAKTQFEMLLDQRPQDTVAHLFVERCKRFEQKAPPPDWDGVHQMNTK